MSRVTNAILTLAAGDDRVDQINKFFTGTGFLKVEKVGGSKWLECTIAIGAFNHLDLAELIEHIRMIQFNFPESVQLIVQEQEDDKFRIIDMFPDS